MAEQDNKMPLIINLILAYVIVRILGSLYVYPSSWGIALLAIVAYEGLWMMKKDWMYLLIVILGALVVINIATLVSTYPYFILVAILDLLSICGLIMNRNSFIDPENKSVYWMLGSKSEWLRLGLILVGIIGFILLIIRLEPGQMIYALLAVLIWSLFVWFAVPKVFEKKK